MALIIDRWGVLMGYGCPGCDILDNPRRNYDAHDLLTHTLRVAGKTGANAECRHCPWCGSQILGHGEPPGWVEIARLYDSHLPHCSKYKLCCIAGTHPPRRQQ